MDGKDAHDAFWSSADLTGNQTGNMCRPSIQSLPILAGQQPNDWQIISVSPFRHHADSVGLRNPLRGRQGEGVERGLPPKGIEFDAFKAWGFSMQRGRR